MVVAFFVDFVRSFQSDLYSPHASHINQLSVPTPCYYLLFILPPSYWFVPHYPHPHRYLIYHTTACAFCGFCLFWFRLRFGFSFCFSFWFALPLFRAPRFCLVSGWDLLLNFTGFTYNHAYVTFFRRVSMMDDARYQYVRFQPLTLGSIPPTTTTPGPITPGPFTTTTCTP